GDAGPAVARGRERRDADGARGERRVPRVREVDVELPQVERVRGEVREDVGRARRRREGRTGRASGPVQIGRQQAGHAGTEVEALGGRGIAREHRGAIEGAGRGTAERDALVEAVERHVIRVGPYADLRVVGEVIAEAVGVPIPG